MSETSNEMQVIESNTIGSTAMMFGAGNFERAMQVANAMASATVSVPNHLRDKPGDCLAIVMQAAQWGMNPFGVAQKTHLVNGTLGYEAQLVNAVIQASGSIKGRFHYEYQGDGPDTMECRVGAVISGEKDITWGEWLASRHVTTKNSPLWKTNPKQQLGYLQVKNWARAYCPGAILGISDIDDLNSYTPPPEREINPPPAGDAPDEQALPGYPDEKIKANAAAWTKYITTGKKTPQDIIDTISTTATLTDKQQKVILALGAVNPDALTFAQVAESLQSAADTDTLDAAADTIAMVEDADQREELAVMYRDLHAKLGS